MDVHCDFSRRQKIYLSCFLLANLLRDRHSSHGDGDYLFPFLKVWIMAHGQVYCGFYAEHPVRIKLAT